jgi:RimJ/RimL family protein N-acetyltransferase
MLRMPPLETARLLVRSFTLADLEAVHQLLDIDLREADFGSEGPQTLSARRQWLQWTILSYEELTKLYQPPYGDRAVVLKQSNQLIGACGFVPCLAPFGQLPSFSSARESAITYGYSTEFGLFYAIAPTYQGQGRDRGCQSPDRLCFRRTETPEDCGDNDAHECRIHQGDAKGGDAHCQEPAPRSTLVASGRDSGKQLKRITGES